jgi:hypothetical protein
MLFHLAWSYAAAAADQVRKAPAMTILFPLPPKPLGADNAEVPNSPRDNMAMQQYMGQLKYQKMLGWLTAMSTLTGGARLCQPGKEDSSRESNLCASNRRWSQHSATAMACTP